MININGKTYVWDNVVVTNGKIIIDGKAVDTEDSKEITIEVTGNIDTLSVDACNTVSIWWDAWSVKTMSGDVEVKWDIKWNAKTMSWDIDCNVLLWAASTMSWDIN